MRAFNCVSSSVEFVRRWGVRLWAFPFARGCTLEASPAEAFGSTGTACWFTGISITRHPPSPKAWDELNSPKSSKARPKAGQVKNDPLMGVTDNRAVNSSPLCTLGSSGAMNAYSAALYARRRHKPDLSLTEPSPMRRSRRDIPPRDLMSGRSRMKRRCLIVAGMGRMPVPPVPTAVRCREPRAVGRQHGALFLPGGYRRSDRKVGEI